MGRLTEVKDEERDRQRGTERHRQGKRKWRY